MSINIILIILFLLFIGVFFLKIQEKVPKTPIDLHIKRPFLTNRERAFYKKLNSILNGSLSIMCQVRLVDVVAINPKYRGGKMGLAYFRRISQWHCDFVLIDDDFNIRCVIELDDNSHNRADRAKRDQYFNLTLNQAGIKLKRFKKIEELNQKILNDL